MNNITIRIVKLSLAFIFLFGFCNDAFCWTFNEITRLKGGYLICDSKVSYDTARSMVDGNDREAYVRFASTGVCSSTKEGMEAYVIKTHVFQGAYEVRAKGETRVLWVDSGAIRDNFTIDTSEDSQQPQVAVQSQRNATKLDGMMRDKGQTIILISQGGKISTLKVGDRVCEGEIIRIYAPGEDDGITSAQSVDKYENRIKIRFAQEEKVFKNGDVICEDPGSESSNWIKGGDEKLKTEPLMNNFNAQVNVKLNQSEDGFYKKRSQEVIAQYESALNRDNNLKFADALEGYRTLLPKAKTAYSTTDMADKKKLHEIIEVSERREKEISRYMETVRDIRGRFNSAGSLSKWLKKNIHYKSDRIAGDYWQPPDETLKVKTGDCEDFAILVQVLLAEVGIPSEIVFIGLKKGIKNSTHAICAFEQGGLYGYFSGPYLHQPFASSIQQLVNEKYPHWTAIAEIKFPTREKIFLARR